MSNQITLVSEFFYIGRDKINNPELVRSNEKYFDYFRQWARMKNKLVVYTDPVFVDKIYEIREGFGLKDQTIVIPVEDVFSLEAEIFAEMEKVSANQDFREYRFFVNAMSNNAKYDYVMLMKYWCLQDAVKRGLVDDMVAWMDFGFNHGGDCFSNPEEFDFLWEYDFARKIHLFALYDPSSYLAMKSWQIQRDCIMGPIIVLPKELSETFWELIKGALDALLWLECIDDDQQLLLMAYKRRSEYFELHISDWFLPLKEYGAPHLSVKPKVKIKKSLYTKLRILWATTAKRTPEHQFAKRMLKAAQGK